MRMGVSFVFLLVAQIARVHAEEVPIISCAQTVAAKWNGGDGKPKSGWRE